MPTYELFVLGASKLARAEKKELFKLAAGIVHSSGGVLTDLQNFGERTLAYKISNAGRRYSEAFAWQMTFASSPATLPPLETALKIDERILRYLVLKTHRFNTLPTRSHVSKQAAKLLNHDLQPLEATPAKPV